MPNLKVNPKGKTVFVSGANRGIGKEIVIELINKGVKTIFAGARDPASLGELVASYGDQVIPVELDVCNDVSIQAAAEKVGKVDILVNNAGVLVGGKLLAEDAMGTIQGNFEVNVFGLLKLTNAVVDLKDTTTEKAIINISSLAGLGNMPVLSTYSVSKAAVHSITQGLRGELANNNTLVMGVYPGAIDTDMAKGLDMDKDTPQNVAKSVVQALIDGEEDVYPDAMSQHYGSQYNANPIGVGQEFGTFV